jgi:hypothetical protein
MDKTRIHFIYPKRKYICENITSLINIIFSEVSLIHNLDIGRRIIISTLPSETGTPEFQH